MKIINLQLSIIFLCSFVSKLASQDLPIAGFDFYGPLYGCAPHQVHFINGSMDETSVLWEFPGGSPSTSTLDEPIVTYNAPGFYDVTITATNAFGSTTLTREDYVQVYSTYSTNFTFTQIGKTVIFTNTDPPTGEIIWDFGDGVYSNQVSPTHIYLEDGTYVVICSAAGICENSTSATIIIESLPLAGFNTDVTFGCQPLTVTFENQSSSNSVSYLWTFPGGTPTSSTDANPTVVYNTEGSYSVTLKVTNPYGTNTAMYSNFIDVNPLPTANFEKTQTGANVVFNNVSYFITGQLWDFGDGSTSTNINPSHTYLNNGTYNVTLNTINDCGTDNMTAQVTIAQPPIASFTSNVSGFPCTGTPIIFSNTSTFEPTSYAWEFEGGTPATSSLENPIVTYSGSGIFNVRLIATNAFGQNESLQLDYINMHTTPTVIINTVPDGLTYSFSADVIDGAFTGWSFGDGSPLNINNPAMHTYSTQGIYNVLANADNGCGVATTNQILTVQVAPTAGFISSGTMACLGTSIQYTSQSSSSTTAWAWTFEGGAPPTSTDQNPIVTYSTIGKYDVSLTVSNNAGQNTLSQADFVTINSIPSVGFTSTVASNQITLTNTGSGATSTTWFVSWDSGTIQLTGSPLTFTAPSNGTYTIAQYNANICGNSSSLSQTATVNAYVNVQFSVPNSICEDTNITFTNSSSNQTNNYWEFVGASPSNSTDINPTLTYAASGTYPVRLIVSNALGQETVDMMVIVGEAPNADYSYLVNNATVQFTYNGASGNSVLWQFGDGTTSNEINPSHTYNTAGNYTVLQLSTNDCGQDIATQVVNIIIVSTKDIDVLGTRVYPNPSDGPVTITLANQSQIGVVTFEIFDVLGRLITSRENDIADIYTIDLAHLLPATYMLRITNNDRISTQKIQIK
jgi:PKD repeat protein